MAVTCSFVAQDWDDMIPGLLAHRYDAIMAAMEITAARQKEIAFSSPYVRMPSAFLVRRDTDIASATPDALAGRRIGVEKGGTHQAFLDKIYPKVTIATYGSLSDAILDLEAARVDAAIGDKDAIVALPEDAARRALLPHLLGRRAALPGIFRRGDRHRPAEGGRCARGRLRQGARRQHGRRHVRQDQRALFLDFPID